MKPCRRFFAVACLASLFVFACCCTPSAWATKWTILVYLDGDNNLEGAGIDDVNEMETVGSNADVKVAVLFDRVPGYDTSNGDWTDTRRGLITQDSNPATISSTLTSVGEKNMGDPATLTQFVQWGVSTYPADHYALVLWNHGGGWRSAEQQIRKQMDLWKERYTQAKTAAERAEATEKIASLRHELEQKGLWKDVCWDDSNGGDVLYTQELRTALESAGTPIDLIGFDACLMQMMEVAYEMRNRGSVMVGSEQTEPGDGWPYDTLLGDLVGNASMSPAQLATSIVTRYGQSYVGGETLAAVDLSKMTALGTSLNDLASTVTTCGTDWAAYSLARSASRYYYNSDYRDLKTFLGTLSTSATTAQVRTAALAAKTNLESAVIANHSSASDAATGLSIYLTRLGAAPSTAYVAANIQFAASTLWDEMLTAAAGQSMPDDALEPNDSSSQARMLSLGSYSSLALQDNDWYSVVLPGGMKISVVVAHSASDGDIDVILYNSSMAQLASAETGSDLECVTYTTTLPGTYYIKVFGYNGDTNDNYNLYLINASNQGFAFQETALQWEATSSATFLAMGDDDYTALPLGFSFPFYGQNYSTIKVGANGYMTFGLSGQLYSNLSIPIPGDPDGIIAPFWDDLVPPASGGGVFYETKGTAGNRKFVVSWLNCPHYGVAGTVSFQVVLFESDGSVHMNYQDVVFGNATYDYGNSATVGLESGDGMKGYEYSCNQPVLRDNVTLRFVPVIPVAGAYSLFYE